MANAKRCEQLYFGIYGLDESKKQFIELVNVLLDYLSNPSPPSDVRIRLSTLANYAGQYFRLEEIYLKKKLEAYEYLNHRKQHLIFENFLRSPIIQKTDDGQDDTEELAGFLADWFNFHMQHLDNDLNDRK